MSETRLVAISGEQVERLQNIARGETIIWSSAEKSDAEVLHSIVTAYEEGITEEQQRLALHAIEAHCAFAPKDELERLRKLRSAFRGDS